MHSGEVIDIFPDTTKTLNFRERGVERETEDGGGGERERDMIKTVGRGERERESCLLYTSPSPRGA